ncbi:Hypothetical protein NocV09_00902190 [Nannochloropsis oceanica]
MKSRCHLIGCGGCLVLLAAATVISSPAVAFVHGPPASSALRILQWAGQGLERTAGDDLDAMAIRSIGGRKRTTTTTAVLSLWGSPRVSSSSSNYNDRAPISQRPRSRGGSSSSSRLFAGLVGGASGGSLTSDGRTNQNFRTLTADDFAANHRVVDNSGNPEKRAEIAAALPGVNLDKLCKEVPDVMLWSPAELAARMAVLAEAMPGEDLIKCVSQAPTILTGTPYLKKTLAQFAEWFPGKTLAELLPRCADATLGTAPRSFEYPKRLGWEVPYLDPGLMGNYTVETELVQAMKESQHLVFGLWKEDGEALEKFVKAVRRAVLAFETRVFFLRDHYPRAHFERYYADDLFGESVGFVDEWAKKHPGYDSYMDEKLAGYENMEFFRLKRLPIAEKEEMLIQARAEGMLGPDGAYRGRSMALPAGARGEEGAEEGAEEDDGWDDLEDVVDETEEGGAEDDDDEFVEAMQHALWVFEVRAGFLERLVGQEAYRNELIRRVRQETAGSAEEFLERYPAYGGHLSEVLDGWGEIEAELWEGVNVDDKEDQMVEMLKARGRAMVYVQNKMASFRPPTIPPVMTERAVESRVEARAKLAAEELEKLEALSDEEVKRHWEAYEAYVMKRFPSVRKDVENLQNSRAAGVLFDDEEDEEEEEFGLGGF